MRAHGAAACLLVALAVATTSCSSDSPSDTGVSGPADTPATFDASPTGSPTTDATSTVATPGTSGGLATTQTPGPDTGPQHRLPANNTTASGPWVFERPGGMPAAFVTWLSNDLDSIVDLVECTSIDCSETARVTLDWLSHRSGEVRPFVLADGNPGAVFNRPGGLVLVRCSDWSCRDGTESPIASGPTFLSTWDVGMFDDGRPVIVTSRDESDAVVLSCDDWACANGITSSASMDNASQEGETFDLNVSEGRPVVISGPLHPSQAEQATRVISCEDMACERPEASTLVPAYAGSGSLDVASSAVGPNGLLSIAYGWNGDPRELRLIHCLRWDCDGFTDTAITPLTGPWNGPSLTMGTDGLPIIAYLNGGVLTVTKCLDTACTSSRTETPLGAAPVESPVIAVGGDGLPIIAYFIPIDPPKTVSGPQREQPVPAPIPVMFRCADPACSAPQA